MTSGDLLLGEVEDLVEHLALVHLDLPVLGRDLEQHLQLRLRVRLALRAVGSIPIARWASSLDRWRTQISGLKTKKNSRTGPRHAERDPLGVAQRDPLRDELADHDVQERDDQEREQHGQNVAEPLVEQLGQHPLAQRADRQRGERDAELHRGDEVRRVARDLHDGARRAAALVRELLHARPAHRDQRVLACHEERVEEDQEADATSSISTVIADTPERSCRPGTCEVLVRRRPHQRTYSEVSRRPLRAGSISDPPVVLDPAGASLQHEPLEVGQGLRDREAPGRRLQVVAEEWERDVVAAQRLGTERRGGRRRVARRGARSAPVRAATGSRIGSPWPRQRDSRLERDRRARAPRGSRRAGRVGSRGHSPTVGEIRIEQVIGSDEHAVAVAASAGRRRGPARPRPATRRRRRPDRGARGRGGSGRTADTRSPCPISSRTTSSGTPFDANQSTSTSAQSSPPQTRLHCVVVEPALGDRRARQLDEVGRCADVIGVEVGDDDPPHGPGAAPRARAPSAPSRRGARDRCRRSSTRRRRGARTRGRGRAVSGAGA